MRAHFRRHRLACSNVDAANAQGTRSLAGLVADRFYVRDIYDPRTSSNRICVGPALGAETRSLSHGIFSNVMLGSVPCEVSRASLSDLYFVDVGRTTPGALLLAQSWASEVLLARLTMVFTREAQGIQYGVSSPFAAAAPELTIDGLLLAGHRGAGAFRAMSLATPANAAQVSWGHPPASTTTQKIEAPAVLAAYGVAPVQGVDPDFLDPSALRFDLAPESPLAGVGCGAREAGYADSDWAHPKTKLAPMYMGNPPPVCGLLGAELVPLVALAARRARRVSRESRGASGRESSCPSGAMYAGHNE